MRDYNKNKLALKFYTVAKADVAFNGKVKRETLEKICMFLEKDASFPALSSQRNNFTQNSY